MKFNYPQFEEELEILLAQDIISGWQAFGPGHYRINDEIDVWPRRKKYMVVNTWECKTYKDLLDICG